MSYSNQLDARRRRRRLSSSSSNAATSRDEHAEYDYKVGNPHSAGRHKMGRPRSPSNLELARPESQDRSARSTVPWNNSVRTGSPVGLTPSATTFEASLKKIKNFARGDEVRPVRRQLASSLDGGHSGPRGNSSNFSTTAGLNDSGRQFAQATRFAASLDSSPRNSSLAFDHNSHYRADDEDRYETFMERARAHRGYARDDDGSLTDTQAQLCRQLQDVVVQLSQNAVEEKKKAAHTKKRMEAYARLVREQDAMLEDLRNATLSLESEKDALLSFRRRDTSYQSARLREVGVDSVLHSEPCAGDGRRRWADGELDDWVRPECSRGTGPRPPHDRLDAAALREVDSDVRDLVRSLALQLREERNRRLEVEEQSSRMIGEQQLALARIESRLWDRIRGSRGHSRQHSLLTGSLARPNEGDETSSNAASVSSPSSASSPRSSSSGSFYRHPRHRHRSRSTRGGEAEEKSLQMPGSKPPLPPPPQPRQPRAGYATPIRERNGLSPGSPQYEDAEAILNDIKRRYNL